MKAKEYPVLQRGEGHCPSRKENERLGHPSSLCGPFSFYTRPKGCVLGEITEEERGTISNSSRRLFDEKLKAGEILLQEDGIVDVHDPPFLKHQNGGKGHVKMASHSDKRREDDT